MSRQRERHRIDRPLGLLYRPIAIACWILLKVFFGLRVKIDPAVKRLKGPLIVIGNHASFADPAIMAAAMLGKKISFVTRRGLFEKSFKRWLLNRLGAIPKSQMRADFAATRRMLRVLRSGGVLGLYPEAQRSLDGTAMPFDPAITKLVKACACPVVVVRLEGAYLTWPRWSRSGVRMGRIDVFIQELFRVEELAELEPPAIEQRIADSLRFNEYQWQRQHPHAFLSLAPARGLETFLHRCPACEKPLVIRSSRFELFCISCSARYRLNRFGFIEPAAPGSDLSSRTWADPQLWHRWQLQKVDEELIKNGQPITCAGWLEAYDQAGARGSAISGQLTLSLDGLQFDSPDLTVSWTDISPSNLVFRLGSHFEMAQGEPLYRLTPEDGQAVIRFVEAIIALGRMKTGDQ